MNRSISDASWGELFSKIAWLAIKSGKPVLGINPKYTSQECSVCGHISKDNRDGEKFICVQCGHIDHADTQASRTILSRANLNFVSTRHKNLRRDSSEVTPSQYKDIPPPKGKRGEGRNRTSKAMPEKRIFFEQLQLQL
ncbi:zinc ribbon domain-containing protein [Nostoc sp.]|uniref:zinc ribbon domain-containing protein n=1 Tax=Nostoc sp. TaxID=1180 RepID=UPI0035940C68